MSMTITLLLAWRVFFPATGKNPTPA